VALVDCMATDPHASPRQSVGGWGRRWLPLAAASFIRNASPQAALAGVEMTYEPRGVRLRKE
jgi:hypothetical protein